MKLFRWQTTQSSCVKLSSMGGAISPRWRSASLNFLTTSKTSLTKIPRFEVYRKHDLALAKALQLAVVSMSSESRIFRTKTRIAFRRCGFCLQRSYLVSSYPTSTQVCENNLEFTNTPHTPMKRDGVLFITQRRQVTLIFLALIRRWWRSGECGERGGEGGEGGGEGCKGDAGADYFVFLKPDLQATSDLRENPLVTVLGSHAAMTCQIVVGNFAMNVMHLNQRWRMIELK